MHAHTGHAYGMIVTVGEPPARFPACAAVAVRGQIKVNVQRRKECVIQAKNGGAVRHFVNVFLNDQLVVIEFAEYFEISNSILTIVYHEH